MTRLDPAPVMGRRRRADRKEAAPLAWTDRVVTELERRVGLLSARMRTGADVGLRGLVITDAEVDGMLDAERASAPSFQTGSLCDVATEHPRVAGHLSLLQRRFGLTVFDLDVLLACLAPEMDRRFERLYAYLNDDLGKPRPTIDTLLRLLAPRRDHVNLQSRLLPDGALLRYGLLANDEAGRSAHAGSFRVASGLVRRLLERDGLDERVERIRLEDGATPLAQRLWRDRSEIAVLRELIECDASATGSTSVVVNVHGRPGAGRDFVVRTATQQAGRPALAIDARKLKRGGHELAALLEAVMREACLSGCPTFLHHADTILEDADLAAETCALLRRWLGEFGGVVILGSQRPVPLHTLFPGTDAVDLPLAPMGFADRERGWTRALEELPLVEKASRDALASSLAARFRLTGGEVATCIQHARLPLRDCRTPEQQASALHALVARVAAPQLHQLAQRLPVMHALTDLVLPADRLELLGDVVRRVQYRRKVLEDWRFDALSPRGRGLVALFHGASGTGKTMAADAIAHTLQMPLFRIDLAGVVSKYIGETEKNLRAIFDEADRADCVLFFDEADALFGKRSEVKDAHDRYANIEINYLLQRIESFDGIAVLATNRRDFIDEAFLRRIHVCIDFPLPLAAERRRLWEASFPSAAPLATHIDWPFLAGRFELTGGAIRNAALTAAYLAAEADSPIGMRQLIQGVRLELVKAGRRVPDSEFGPYAELLETAPAATPPHSRASTRAANEEE